MARGALVAIPVVLLLVTSGCTGGSGAPGSPKDADVPVFAPPASADPVTCGLEGVVTDESLLPIANASVTLEGTPRSAVTDPGGGFSFSFLTPASYQMVASAYGYAPVTRLVTCVSGATERGIQLTLTELPDSDRPYVAVLHDNGRLGCSLSFLVETTDTCASFGSALFPNAKSTHRWKLEKNAYVTTAVYEMKWNQNGPLGGRFLTLTFPRVRDPAHDQYTTCPGTTIRIGLDYAQVMGESRLCIALTGPSRDNPVYIVDENGDAGQDHKFEFKVKAANNFDEIWRANNPLQLPDPNRLLAWQDRSSKLVFDQPYELYVTVAYNEARLVEAYSAFD